MAVFELKALIAAAEADAWSDVLAENEIATLMVVEDKVAAQAWLAGYFESESAARDAWSLLAVCPTSLSRPESVVVRALPDADWKDSYKQHFKPQHFGHLHWVPIWERPTYPVPPGDAVLWLDPGMAFGTGNHETTRLCCERLTAFAAERSTRSSVIDAGCGSGILALSAVLLGFSEVRGFDNDPVAIDVSRQNALLNGLEGRFAFEVGDLTTGFASRRADLVMANIQADVLMRFAGELARAVKPGGWLVLSGILAAELDTVRKAFAAEAPHARIESRVLGEWADLVVSFG